MKSLFFFFKQKKKIANQVVAQTPIYISSYWVLKKVITQEGRLESSKLYGGRATTRRPLRNKKKKNLYERKRKV